MKKVIYTFWAALLLTLAVVPLADGAYNVPLPLGGDASGTTAAVVNGKINGTTVPAGGSLTTGNSLGVTGAGALSYGPLNLAGGANYVTGSLPTANQVVQSMAGDVTGTTAASVVAKVNGTTVPAGGALTTGNACYISGASACTYSAVNLAGGAGWVSGLLPNGNQAAQTLTGDVTGNTGATVVSAIAGSSPIAITPANLQYTTGTVAPTISQASESTVTKGADLTLTPQTSTHATDQGGGNLVASLEAPTGAGVEAGFVVNRGATLAAQLGPLPGAGSTTSALCIEPGQTCNATHYTVQEINGGLTTINGTTGVYISVGGTQKIQSGASFFGPIANNAMESGASGQSWSNIFSVLGSFSGAVSGDANKPFTWGSSATQAVTASAVTLSNAQIMTPVIPLNGTINASNCTITVPNTVGGHWYFDLTSVVFGGHNLVFTTGSGTSATISSIGLTGQFLLTCVVAASNVVSCGGA